MDCNQTTIEYIGKMFFVHQMAGVSLVCHFFFLGSHQQDNKFSYGACIKRTAVSVEDETLSCIVHARQLHIEKKENEDGHE